MKKKTVYRTLSLPLCTRTSDYNVVIKYRQKYIQGAPKNSMPLPNYQQVKSYTRIKACQ